MENIKRAQEEFKELIESEYARIDKMKQAEEATDFSKKKKSLLVSFQEMESGRSLWNRQFVL
ncbi:MAG: hypothetical protein ACLUTO_02800 [Anaerostipes sp.]